MKILQALPRRMRFDKRFATSVELCVSEWVSGSRYRGDTTILAERGEHPLIDVDVHRLRPAKLLTSWQLALEIRREVARRNADLVVTQQHLATAGRIALFNPGTPVVLQTHNFIDGPKTGKGALVSNLLTRRYLQSLGGITLISEAVKRRFEADWPSVTTPRAVVTNGFDFSTWTPAAEREKLIVVVGRTREEKGLLEAAEGVTAFLAGRPDWRACFVISEPGRDPAYHRRILSALEPAGSQNEVRTDIPFSVVKALTEKAAISVVASKWEEPFGRTALEAHAAGIALVSSGSGGLREISGDCAVFLSAVTGDEVRRALDRLADDEALRERIGREGAIRVRQLFSLEPPSNGASSVCTRLDDFYDRVVAGFASAPAERAA